METPEGPGQYAVSLSQKDPAAAAPVTFRGISIQPKEKGVEWVKIDETMFQVKDQSQCVKDNNDDVFPDKVTHIDARDKTLEKPILFPFNLENIDGFKAKIIIVQNYSTYWVKSL